MFQVFTGDVGQTSHLLSSLKPINPPCPLFVSCIFIAGIVLLNVVVAVLSSLSLAKPINLMLHEFIKFIGFEKDREAAEREARREKMRVTGCLDPLVPSKTVS